MNSNSNKTHLYESLGKMMVSFRELERGVDKMILSCLDFRHTQGAILSDGMSFPQKMIAMNQLIRSLYTEKELINLQYTSEVLLDRALYCERQRNEWLRSYWAPEVESKPGIVMRLQRTVDESELELIPVNVIELENLVVVLDATHVYLHRLHQTLINNFKRTRHG